MHKKLITLLLFVFFTSSCGFNVIYKGNNLDKDSYVKELSSIRIKKDRNRLSQELKNHLYELFNPDLIKSEPKYFLILSAAESVGSTYTTATGSSGRNKVSINITYTLLNIENGAIISSGETSVNDNYDVTSNRYGTYTAEKYIQNNLTKIAAQNIRNSLINDFVEVKKRCNGEIKENYYEEESDNEENSEQEIKDAFKCPLKVEKGEDFEPYIDLKQQQP